MQRYLRQHFRYLRPIFTLPVSLELRAKVRLYGVTNFTILPIKEKMAGGPLEPIEVLEAFKSYKCDTDVLQIMRNADPTVAVLALDNLFRIKDNVQSNEFGIIYEIVRDFLRRWRSESPLSGAYECPFRKVHRILRSLAIFKTFNVPLFIDYVGQKKLLSNYVNEIEPIPIDGNTTICHDTHVAEAQAISGEQQLKPSDNKNIIGGCWFGLESEPSAYGGKRFKTTLSKLGVTGLHQGEIVSYKYENNVILYAADKTDFKGLKKPTDEAVKKNNPNAYVHVSIFVPSRFLSFMVINGPFEVQHGPICVRALRSFTTCKEL